MLSNLIIGVLFLVVLVATVFLSYSLGFDADDNYCIGLNDDSLISNGLNSYE